MARLSRLEDNFGRDYRDAFEDMATHMLVAEFGLPHAPLRRKNQAGIEADPVKRDDGRSFAYQVKYLDATTEARTQEEPFKGAVREAHAKGATDLVLYLNKLLTQDPKTRRPPEWERDVADEALKAGVRLHWRELSRIEAMLDNPNRPDYGRIRDMYLGGHRGEDAVVGFYRDTCERFFGDTGGELYGDVPLSECYIEPTVDVMGSDGAYLTVREWVESFVEGDDTVAVLCGEPGHGKTSLCRKAAVDFYKSGWLAGRVSNVFCFSLNPANTDALEHESFDVHSLLSWGNDRRSTRHRIAEEHCRGALVFLDAFDELLEWHPAFGLGGFVRDHVLPFQRETGTHVVITTRSMVVEPGAKALRVMRKTIVPVARMRPITRGQQIGWIGEYAERLRGRLAGGQCPSREGAGTEKELSELQDYAERYASLGDAGDLQKVLGVPIIFRMVVAARYLPREGEPITRIYDDLFDATWERHRHRATGPSSDPCEETRGRLMRHALRVFADDADTAVVDGILESSWLFSFYMTHRGRMRVGFLHRSFYQHFLARETLSWFERFASGEDDEAAFRDNLSYLARRRLDETTLGYIRDMHADVEDKESIGPAFDKAYEVLKETDGILQLPEDERDTSQIKLVASLERANNVFWNVVSVCSICDHELSNKKVHAFSLQSYRLNGCILTNADLMGAILARADLMGAILARADLEESDLARADLARADLARADLRRATLTQANLEGADLAQANLAQANLGGATLAQANLEGADLRRANLRGVNLEGADLRRANLEGADLESADLRWANFEGADLRGVNFEVVNLTHANFEGVVYDEGY